MFRHNINKKLRIILYSIILLLSSILFPSIAFSQWTQTKFIIGTWVDPRLTIHTFNPSHPNYKDVELDKVSFKLAKDAHFNLLTGGKEGSYDEVLYNLKIADFIGLKSLVNDNRINFRQPFNKLAVKDYIGIDVNKRNAMFGYSVGDEPGVESDPPDIADNVKRWISHVKTEDPSKLAYINLLPIFGSPSAPAYESYLDTYLNDPDHSKNPDVVSFDHYPFLKNSNFRSTGYFLNLSIIKKKAGERPFWTFPMSVGHRITYPNGFSEDLVDPNENHLRFMVFCPIAYGAKGLIYFTYERPKSDSIIVYRDALIDDVGMPTSKYYIVKTINHYITEVLGPIVMNSVHLGAFHKSDTPIGQVILEDEKINLKTPLISDVNNENILIGLFRDTDNYYGLIVNKSLSSTPTVVLTLKGDYRDKIELAPSVTNYRDGFTYSSRIASYDATAKTTQFSIPSLAGGEGRLVKLGAPNAFTDLIGDRDNFHSGDTDDKARMSVWLIGTLGEIAASPDYLPGVDLDLWGFNRPVGLTQVIPTNAFITSAKVGFRLRSIDALVYNDNILYDDSASQGSGQPFLPFIALRDLLGREPQQGETLDLRMDLSRVPVRTQDTSGGPGGHFTPNPDEYRNLLPLLADGEFNMVFMDDLTVDYSELRVTYADAKYLVTFKPIKPTSPPSTTDTTGCPVDFDGKYSFDALLTNISGMMLSDLRIGINELSNDNLLLATDGERLEAGEWVNVPEKDGYGDQKLDQGEWVKVPFTVCMKAWKPFRLFVNVSGVAQ